MDACRCRGRSVCSFRRQLKRQLERLDTARGQNEGCQKEGQWGTHEQQTPSACKYAFKNRCKAQNRFWHAGAQIAAKTSPSPRRQQEVLPTLSADPNLPVAVPEPQRSRQVESKPEALSPKPLIIDPLTQTLLNSAVSTRTHRSPEAPKNPKPKVPKQRSLEPKTCHEPFQGLRLHPWNFLGLALSCRAMLYGAILHDAMLYKSII